MNGLVINSRDPAYNLALEQHLFDSLDPQSSGWFLLWHNAPSVIVGRHQNTLQEVNQELVRRFDLPVVRRMTGGGAVYHDTGNLNFSFLQPLTPGEAASPIDFGRFLRPILEALEGLGIKAEFSSRNDITIGERKISGSAQLRRPHGVLHHGTLMVSLDLDMLGAVLTGAPDKYLSKGIASLRSRVVNVAEIAPAGVGMDEIKAALMARCATQVVPLPPDVDAAAEALARSRYRSWEWNYGASPAFTERRRQRFPWGAVECCLDVSKGVVRSCRIFGDFFAQRDVAELEARFVGCQHAQESLLAAVSHLTPVEWDYFFAGCDVTAMRDFFCRC